MCPKIHDMTPFSRNHRESRLIKHYMCFGLDKIQDILEKYPRDPKSVWSWVGYQCPLENWS